VMEWSPDGTPSAFLWHGQRYAIRDIVSDARQVDPNPRWYLRRHRRRLIVRADNGVYYELYATRPGRWILYRQLEDPFA
jgi:hypothetical protein